MNAVFFIGIGISIFLSALVVVKKKKQLHDFVLLAWLIINGLHLLYFYTNIIAGIDQVPILILIPGALLAYISAPMLLLYVKALISPTERKFWNYFPHFIPFLIMLLGIYAIDIFTSETKVQIVNTIITFKGKQPPIFGYYAIIMAFSHMVYLTWSILILHKHRLQLKEEFSYIDKITLNWLKRWLIMEFVGFWISFIIVWVANFEYIEFLSSFKVISIIIAINVFVIGFYGIRQDGIFIQYLPRPLVKQHESSKVNQISSEKLEKYSNSLLLLMEKDQVYLNPKLNASDLSQELGVSRHNMSKILNDELGENFYDFVNKYRIKEFKKRIQNPDYKHLSILGIALDCGFNSKSSFNLVFKKLEGITPSAFKKGLN